ncbi:MAG: MoxR family ATPase [Acidimicrobiales bacterium]|nr:MoxR family ATPase [Acidimicrobiales bacterium]
MTETTSSTRERTESFASLHDALRENIATVIQGKEEAIDLLLICLVAEGHLLVEDVPGVGKTSLAKALARSIDAPFGRIQFTPDLLPTDITGVNVWHRGAERFDLHRGPVFASILIADEINRASPKTQSALLEAMAERQVTIDGVRYPLGSPFFVIATQNPIEHEGTYALPESQLDRFLMKLSLGYPDRSAEIQMLQAHGENPVIDTLQPVLDVAQVNGLVAAARGVHVAEPLLGYLADLAAASRRHPAAAVGMSPRATLALQRAARARAATRGRNYVTPDDIKALAEPVLAHRILLTPDSLVSRRTSAEVVRELLATVPQPSPLDGQRSG